MCFCQPDVKTPCCGSDRCHVIAGTTHVQCGWCNATTPTKHREGDQPLPKPVGGPSMQDLVIEDLRSGGGGTNLGGTNLELFNQLLINDIEARKAIGIRRYGQTLKAFDGRDNLLDAYHEAIDLVVYLRKDIYEQRGGPLSMKNYMKALEILAWLRKRLHDRDGDIEKIYS